MTATSGAIALIPARSGSKGVPGKNLAELGGAPLIAWTVAAARDCPAIARTVVSTDDPAIAETVTAWGGEAPFLRPAALAEDTTAMIDVAIHFVEALDLSDDATVVLLQPTSPLREAADIAAALETFHASGARALIAVVESESHPAWSLSIDTQGRVSPFLPDLDKGTRRQDLAPAFRPNGAIYITRAAEIRRGAGWSGPDTIAFRMPRDRSIDIDEPWDLELARAIVRTRGPTIENPLKVT